MLAMIIILQAINLNLLMKRDKLFKNMKSLIKNYYSAKWLFSSYNHLLKGRRTQWWIWIKSVRIKT